MALIIPIMQLGTVLESLLLKLLHHLNIKNGIYYFAMKSVIGVVHPGLSNKSFR